MESAKDSIYFDNNNLALLHTIQQQLFSHLHFLILYVTSLYSYSVSLIYHVYSHFTPMQMFFLIFFGPFFILLFILILFRLLKKLLHIFFPFIWTKLLDKPQESTFLEVTFPSDTNKSAYATEQLYRLLHQLAQPKNYLALYIKRKITFSLEVVSSKERGIRYLIVVPTDTKEILKRTITSYLPGVKISEVTDYLPSHTGLTQRQKPTKEYCKKVSIEELKFSNHFALPLAEQKTLSVTDPSTFLTGNMTKLSEDEIIAYQLVVTPVLPKMQKEIGRSIKKLQQKIHNGEPIERSLSLNFWQQLTEVAIVSELCGLLKIECLMVGLFLHSIVTMCEAVMTTGSTVAINSLTPLHPELSIPYEEELQEAVKEKLSQPLFEVSARLVVVHEDETERKQRIQGLMATFAQMKSEYQSFTTKGSFFLSRSTVKFRLQKFIQRRLSPGSPYNPNPIVSASEITDLFHFPYLDTNKTEDMEKVLSPVLPTPLMVKNTKDFDVAFATNNYSGQTIPIGLTDDERSRHMYIVGQTGSGKSTILFHSAKDDIQKGRGVCVVDPHGDLVEDLLQIIPEERINDVVYINPIDIAFPIRMNLLELTPGLTADELELEKEIVAESAISILRRIFFQNSNTNAHKIEYILRNAIYTAFYTKDQTIFTVYKLLTDETYRNTILKTVPDENIKNFWKNEFGKAGDWQVFKMISGVTAKVGRFQFSPITRRMLEEGHSSINFDELLDEKKIILCNLSEGQLGEDNSYLLGTTIIGKIHLSMLKRARRNIAYREPFYLYVDEFQNFATDHFTKLLSGGRKYGLRVTVAEQSTTQQSNRSIVNVILANVGTVLCFKTASPVDEDLLLPQFSPQVGKGDILNLPRHNFYMKLGSKEPQEQFSGTTYPVEVPTNTEKVTKIIEASRKNHTTPYQPKNISSTFSMSLKKSNNKKKNLT